MPQKSTALEISATLSARSVAVARGAGGGEDLDDIRVENIEVGGVSYSREDLILAFGHGAALMLDTFFNVQEDGDGWAS